MKFSNCQAYLTYAHKEAKQINTIKIHTIAIKQS